MSGDIAVQYRRLYGGGYEIRGILQYIDQLQH